MTFEDLKENFGVDSIQQQAYEKRFREDLAVFADKLQRFPEGCWVCVDGGKPVGYMFSHPSRLTSPPCLNKLLNDSTGDDCYYIHDIAVMTSHRRLGIAQHFVTNALRAALKYGYTIVALVSVQGSSGYWQRFGFQPLPCTKEILNGIRQSYGDDACYMAQCIAPQ